MYTEEWFNKPGEISKLHEFAKRVCKLYSNSGSALDILTCIIDRAYQRKQFNRLPAHYQIANIKSIVRSTAPYAATRRDIQTLECISSALTQADYEFTGNFHEMFQALSKYNEKEGKLPNKTHFDRIIKETLLKNRPVAQTDARDSMDGFSRLVTQVEQERRELADEVEAGHTYVPDISGEVRPDIFNIWTKKREKDE